VGAEPQAAAVAAETWCGRQPAVAGQPALAEAAPEPWVAAAVAARVAPAAPGAVVVEPQAAAVAVWGALPAWEALPVARAQGERPSAGPQPPATGYRNIRRICCLGEMTCGTLDTLPAGWAVRRRPAGRAQAAPEPRPLLLPGAFRSARTWAQKPGSCFRKMGSGCNVQFLVHLRRRSWSMLVSFFLLTRLWL
jgi:hypothetical protein